jgi:hypothetical protein
VLCPNGHDVAADARFCPHCGAAVGEPESTLGGSMESALSRTPRKRRPLVVGLIIATAVIAVGVAVGGGILFFAVGISKSQEKHTLSGTLEAPDCAGGWDIANAVVEVTDESGKLIGSSSTGSNELTGHGCKVSFTVPDVPKAKFYQLKVGTHGAPSYSYSDLVGRGFDVSMTIGGGAAAARPENSYTTLFRRGIVKTNLGQPRYWGLLNLGYQWTDKVHTPPYWTRSQLSCIIKEAEWKYTQPEFIRVIDASDKLASPLNQKWQAIAQLCQ